MSIELFVLELKVEIYQSLFDDVDIPRVHAYETKCEFNVMMFDLLKSSLKDLFNFCDRQFSLKIVLMFVD